jgi:hypothetical protein
MERAGKPRHRSQNPRGEGESAGSDQIKAFGVETRPPLFSLELEWNNKTEFYNRDLN